MINAAAYLRVSRDSQDCASQRHAIEQWLLKNPGFVVRYYQDDGISGTTTKRPGFQAMLAAIAAGEVSAVLTYRLDRLSRSAPVALRLLLDWLRDDIGFFAIDQPILHLGKDNPIRLTVASLFAELADLERQAIVGRVKAGLAAARARGVRLGARSKLSEAQLAGAKRMRAEGLTLTEIATQYGVSSATISRWVSK